MNTMKTLILTVACCLMAIAQTQAKDFVRPESSNYIKGVEALNAGNAEQAYQYLNEEINQNPDNGYAHCYMALVCNFYGDMKLALYAANESVKLIPEEDTEYRSFAYYTRHTLHERSGIRSGRERFGRSYPPDSLRCRELQDPC